MEIRPRMGQAPSLRQQGKAASPRKEAQDQEAEARPEEEITRFQRKSGQGFPRPHNRDRAKHHDERLARLRQGSELKPNYKRGQHEAEVVPGFQISAVLKEWVVEFLRVHEPKFRGDPDYIGPLQVLAARTEINIRKVSAIVNGENEIVSLSKADKLLDAIDKSYLLGTDEIQVVPSPYWSLETWIEYMRERGCV